MKRKLRILTGYRHKDVSLYTPKKDKKKLAIFGGFMILSGLIPGPNLIGIGVFKLITKFRPLYFFK